MDPAIEVKQEPVSTSAEESTVTDSNNPQTLAVSAVSSHVSRPANSVPISAAGVAPRLASVHIPSVITPRKELSTPVRLILEPNIGTAIPSASQQSVVGMNQQTVLLGTSQFVATASPRKLVTVPVVPTAGSLRPLARPMVVGVRNMQPVLQPLPVTLTNSPGKLNVFPTPRLQPSSNNSLLGVAQQATKAPGLSPYKVVIRSSAVTNVSLQPVTVTMPAGIGSHPTTSTNLTTVASPIVRPLIAAAAGLGNVQQLPVSGSKFQYVRLVAAPTGPTAPSVTASPAKGVITVADGSKLVAVGISDTVTAKFNEMLRQKSGQVTSAASMPLKRMILPATTATLSSSVIGEITKSANMNNASSQMLKAAKEFQNKDTGITLKIQLPSQVPPIVIKPEAAAVSLTKSEPNPRHTGNGSVDEPSQKPRKPCNCTKSQCLKLYCDCFANGEFCNGCNCCNCANNLEHEDDRLRAIRACLERNPLAFHPKIGKGREGDVVSRQHAKGCNCKRSGCLKNYCECFEAKIPCSNLCRCFGCKNYEDDLQHKTLMHLADAAEVRVLQQVAANSKLATPFAERHRMNDKSSGKRPAYSFVTTEVVEATCACLIATLEDSSAWSMPDVATEKLVLEEFGRCLLKVIESANGSSLGI